MNTPSAPSRDRLLRYRRGRRAEWMAAMFMMCRGYRILSLRYKTPVGEIDLVAKRGRRIAFVEVKRRRTHEDALWSITPKLRHRVRRASGLWLRRHAPKHTGDIGFDIIALAPRSWPHYVRDAFDHT